LKFVKHKFQELFLLLQTPSPAIIPFSYWYYHSILGIKQHKTSLLYTSKYQYYKIADVCRHNC